MAGSKGMAAARHGGGKQQGWSLQPPQHSRVPPGLSPASADTSASFWPRRPYVGRPNDSSVPACGAGGQGASGTPHNNALTPGRAAQHATATNRRTEPAKGMLAAPGGVPLCRRRRRTFLREHQRVVLPAAHQGAALALQRFDQRGCIHRHLACTHTHARDKQNCRRRTHKAEHGNRRAAHRPVRMNSRAAHPAALAVRSC